MCGWPEVEGACAACGAAAEPVPTRRDHTHPALAPPRPDDYPELKAAFVAWSQGDWARMMGQCLVALGIDRPIVSKRPEGPGWAFVEDSAAIYVLIDHARQSVAVESPLLLLPASRRVPLLRAVLDLNAGAVGLARFVLRRDRVLLTFSDQLANVSPPKLVLAIRDVALRADQLDDALAIAFDAEMLGPKAQRQNLDWSFVGQAIPLVLPDVEMDAPPPLPLDAILGVVDEGEGALYETPELLDLGLDLSLDDDGPPEASARQPDALATFLEECLRLVDPLDVPEDRALMERATLFHAHARYRESHPDAINLLLARAQSMLAVSWGKTESRVGALARMAKGLGGPGHAAQGVRPYLEFVMQELVDKQGEVGPQPRVTLEPLAATPEARALLTRLAELADLLPQSTAIRYFVYSGLLLEVVARFSFTEKTKERIRAELEQHAAPSPESVARLTHLVGRLAQ